MIDSNFQSAAHTQDSNRRLTLLFLLLSVSAILSYNYYELVEKRYVKQRINLQTDILSGDAPSPYRYRILIPLISEATTVTLTKAGLNTRAAFNISHFLINLFSISLFIYFSTLFFKRFFDFRTCLIGSGILSILLLLSLRDHYYQPWSITEAACAAFLFSRSKAPNILLMLSVITIATINRETGILLAGIYFGVLIHQENSQKFSRILMKTSLVTIYAVFLYIAIRYVQGNTEHIRSLSEILAKNMGSISKSLIIFTMFLAPIFIAAKNSFSESIKLTFPYSYYIWAYLLLFSLFGVWYEIRVLLPIFPILIIPILLELRKEKH